MRLSLPRPLHLTSFSRTAIPQPYLTSDTHQTLLRLKEYFDLLSPTGSCLEFVYCNSPITSKLRSSLSILKFLPVLPAVFYCAEVVSHLTTHVTKLSKSFKILDYLKSTGIRYVYDSWFVNSFDLYVNSLVTSISAAFTVSFDLIYKV